MLMETRKGRRIAPALRHYVLVNHIIRRFYATLGYFDPVGAAAAGAAAFWIDTHSTSKISVAFGPIPGGPCAPYARLDGTNNCHFDPTGISCSASVRPAITPFTGKLAGPPCFSDASNSVP